MNKIILAITGASGSVYAKVIMDELVKAQKQVEHVGVVMTTNAKQVWETELQNEDYKKYLKRIPAMNGEGPQRAPASKN